MDSRLRILKYRYSKGYRRIIRFLCSKLYLDTNKSIHNSVLVAGTARSGTSWLADIVASQIPCRIMFEPFNSKLVKEYSKFNYFQYMRVDEERPDLFIYVRRLLSGDIRNKWVDRQVESIFPKYRIIKAIRANLFLKWINTNFPQIPILFIIRHPCAVVLSRMQLSWATDKDIDFFFQPKLINDFLVDKIDIIEDANTDEKKHALIWCISNLVPLMQFRDSTLKPIYYEHLCIYPEKHIPRISRMVGFNSDQLSLTSMNKPSITATDISAVITGENKLMRWKKELSSRQIDDILSVVENFELEYLYGESVLPLSTAP